MGFGKWRRKWVYIASCTLLSKEEDEEAITLSSYRAACEEVKSRECEQFDFFSVLKFFPVLYPQST